MSPLAERYVVTVVNATSNLVELTDLGLGTRPTNGTNAVLVGGNDGLVGIADADYVGTLSAQNGIYAFENIPIINLMDVPGVATPAVHSALVNYADVQRGGIPLVMTQGPQGSNAAAIDAYVITTAGLLNLSDCGSIFWPWCEIANPDTSVYGTAETILIPPSPIMAGRAAMTDVEVLGGVYQAPAGLLYGTLGIVLGIDSEDAQDERKRDIVYPHRINPIHKDEGTPYYCDGSRTLSAASQYPSIGQRRGRSHIELELGFQLNYLRHLRVNTQTRQEAARICLQYLNEQMGLGAFVSKVPALAYSVDVGDGINPPAEENAGRMHINLRMRLAGSYEWILVQITSQGITA
jgi:hypothetical protein